MSTSRSRSSGRSRATLVPRDAPRRRIRSAGAWPRRWRPPSGACLRGWSGRASDTTRTATSSSTTGRWTCPRTGCSSSASTPSTGRAAMLERVRDWIDAGGRFVVLGGNSINCEVEPCRRRPHAALPDPAHVHRWFAGDAGRRRSVGLVRLALPSHRVLRGLRDGARDDGDRHHDGRAVPRVADGASGHWVFAGTGLRDGDLFGERSLHERCAGRRIGSRDRQADSADTTGVPAAGQGHEPRRWWRGDRAPWRASATSAVGAVFNVGSIT